MGKKALMEEIRALTDAEIADRIDEAKEEMFNLRFQKAVGQLENTSRLPKLRRNIARLKTTLRQRQLAAELAQEENNA